MVHFKIPILQGQLQVVSGSTLHKSVTNRNSTDFSLYYRKTFIFLVQRKWPSSSDRGKCVQNVPSKYGGVNSENGSTVCRERKSEKCFKKSSTTRKYEIEGVGYLYGFGYFTSIKRSRLTMYSPLFHNKNQSIVLLNVYISGSSEKNRVIPLSMFTKKQGVDS